MKQERQFKTVSGVELEEKYTPKDIEGFKYEEKLGDPGHYPYTRGITEKMYRDQLWIMGQYSGFSTAEEANKRYKYLIEQGQTGFSIALDLPTQMGLDSDHPNADGEIGKVGVAIDSLKDIELLFDGIDLEKVRQIRTTANANSLILMAMFVAYAKKNKVDPNNIKFFLQNDVLKEYICRGTYIFPPEPSVKLSIDVIEYCSKHLPSWTPMAVCGYHVRDAGATASQELAFTFANMICYVDKAVARGIDIDTFAPSLFTFLASNVDLLEEVAKFRAARRIYAKLMKERYNAKDPKSQQLNIFAYTLGGALTALQPLNNIARVTIETLAAVMGGVQTIATSSYDEAFSIPTEESVKIALRTQQIVAYESGVVNTVDMMGGSYAVEKLTDEIEKYVFDFLEKIEKMGGAVACIEKGYFQRELIDSAYQYQKNVDNKGRIIVGVNEFKDDVEPKIPVFKVNDEVQERQIEKLNKLKNQRDVEKAKQSLEKIAKMAKTEENLAETLIEAVENYVTIGEICEVLRQEYGTYKPSAIF